MGVSDLYVLSTGSGGAGGRMPAQLSLEGLEAPEPRDDRLFFALKPAPAIVPAIDALADDLKRRHGWPRAGRVGSDRLHITLHHLGDHVGVPQSLVDRATQAAESLSAAPFDVAFDRVMTFTRHNGKMPTVLASSLDNAPLMDFQKRLGDVMRTFGLGRCVDIRFTPHVTLHYVNRAVPEEVVEPISWQVTEFFLIHSLLGRSEHRILGRWSL
jgi:RNA 2',3'-cyclic 3'-phosphodiesterase